MRIKQKSVVGKKQKSLNVKKSFNQIGFPQKVLHQNIRAFKGNRKDTNLLNINFKTIINKVLQQMRHTKQLTAQELQAINIFKEASPSFQNLVDLIYRPKNSFDKRKLIKKSSCQTNKTKSLKESENQNLVKSPNIFLRLKRLFQSSQILRRIYENEGTLIIKLLMVKYVEAIRYTIIGSGQIIKWKQIREVPQIK